MDTLTQGTQAWIVEQDGTITGNICLFDLDEVTDNMTEIETTTFCETEAKQYTYGLVDSEITATLKFDAGDPAVQKIIDLYRSQDECTFVIGLSDGVGSPTWSGQIDYPLHRSFLIFDFIIHEVPTTFEKDDLVTIQVPLRLTSGHILRTPFAGSWMAGRGFQGFWQGNIAWQTN